MLTNQPKNKSVSSNKLKTFIAIEVASLQDWSQRSLPSVIHVLCNFLLLRVGLTYWFIYNKYGRSDPETRP